MEFTIDVALIKKEIGFVVSALDEKDAVGIIAKGETITLYCSNGNEELCSVFGAKIKEEGTVFVNSKFAKQLSHFPDKEITINSNKTTLVSKAGNRRYTSALLDSSVFYPELKELDVEYITAPSDLVKTLTQASRSAKKGEVGTYYGYVHISGSKGWVVGSTRDYSTIIKAGIDLGDLNIKESVVSRYLRHLSGEITLSTDYAIVFGCTNDDVYRRVCLSRAAISYSPKAYKVFDLLKQGDVEFDGYFTKILVSVKELKRALSVCRSYSDNVNKYAEVHVKHNSVKFKIEDEVSSANEVVDYLELDLKNDTEFFKIDVSQLSNAISGLTENVELYLYKNKPLVVVSGDFNYIQAPARARAIDTGE